MTISIDLASPQAFPTRYQTAIGTPVVITVVDPVIDLTGIVINVTMLGSTVTAFDGISQGDFTASYDARSTVAAIAHGYSFSVLPDAGWTAGTISIEVQATGDAAPIYIVIGADLYVLGSASDPVSETFDLVIVNTSEDVRDAVWRWRRRLNRQKCSVISIAIDDDYSTGAGFVLTALGLEIGKKPGLDRSPWRGGTYTNSSGSGENDNGR